MANTVKDTIKTRCIAILAADGVNDASLNTMKKALETPYVFFEIDNGILIVGSTTSIGAGNRDVYLLKLDSAGNYLWSKAIGNSGNDIATAVLEMADHGFLITGYTDGFGLGGNAPFLLRTDSGWN